MISARKSLAQKIKVKKLTKGLLLLLSLPMLLIFSSCASQEMRDAETIGELRNSLTAVSSLELEAQLTADYGTSVEEYRLLYTESGEGCRVEVIEPELIAGIAAVMGPESSTLEFEGLVLETGKLDELGLTPVTALPGSLEALRQGHIEAIWRESDEEGEFISVEIAASDNSILTVWLSAEELIPIRFETRDTDGKMVVSCTINSWNTNE